MKIEKNIQIPETPEGDIPLGEMEEGDSVFIEDMGRQEVVQEVLSYNSKYSQKFKFKIAVEKMELDGEKIIGLRLWCISK